MTKSRAVKVADIALLDNIPKRGSMGLSLTHKICFGMIPPTSSFLIINILS